MSKKHNKYAQDAIAEDIFDFHGLGVLTVEEIEEHTYRFLWKSHQNHLHKVRIITGKGLRSPNGPVIRPVVESYLRRLPFVRNFGFAKYNEGGQGALDILLEEPEL